ncbi:hypothetical protein Pelo_17530 [Pelomyxa schiedti]|nr:hypothetical protein Pelo_17530 [Pelomyxa schiedti]
MTTALSEDQREAMREACWRGVMPELPSSPTWDINTPIGRDGETMLHLACLNGDVSLVQQVLGAVGAASRSPPIDPNTPDGHGLTPLWYAARWGKEAVVRLLVARPDVGVNVAYPLHIACWGHRTKAVAALLECPRVDVNLVARTGADKSLDGRTALHVACEEASLEGVKALLEVNGIDTNCKNNKGETPLDVATRRQCPGICNLLRDHNARLQSSKPATTITINTPESSSTFEVEMREKEREIARITVENKRLGDEMNERVLILEGKLQEKEKRILTLEEENSVLKSCYQETEAALCEQQTDAENLRKDLTEEVERYKTIVNTMTSLISATIDDFGVMKLLGTGSNAAAFHVQHRSTMFNNHSTNNQISSTSTTASAQTRTTTRTRTDMVMKVVFNWENAPRQTLVRQKYMVECVALSLVPNHPNVIHPLGALVIPCLPAEFAEKIPSDKSFYRQLGNNKSLAILMPHCGITLSSFLSSPSSNCMTTVQVAQNLFVQGLKAIFHIESHFVVHRDIKGDNILVEPETGKLTLIDFGEALHCPNMEMMVTATSQAWGNTGTIPPELSTFLKSLTRGTSGVFSFSKCDSFALALTFWNALLPPDHKFIGNHDVSRDMSSFNTQSLLSDFPVPLFSPSPPSVLTAGQVSTRAAAALQQAQPTPTATKRRRQNNSITNEINGQTGLLETVMIEMMNPDKSARLGAADAIHSLTSC